MPRIPNHVTGGLLWLVVISGVSVPRGYGQDLPAQKPTASEAPVPDISELAWLSGYWSDGQTEECWLPPKGRLMLGMNRTVSGQRAAFETLRIEQRPNGIVYVASPGGGPATEFELTKLSPAQAEFANPAHDFPQTLTYTRSENKLLVRAVGTITGKRRTLEWSWTKRTLGNSPPEPAP